MTIQHKPECPEANTTHLDHCECGPRNDWPYNVALELAAQVAERWAKSPPCTQHEDNPCCHVRTGAAIAEAIRREKQSLVPPAAELLQQAEEIISDAAGLCDEAGLGSTKERDWLHLYWLHSK